MARSERYLGWAWSVDPNRPTIPRSDERPRHTTKKWKWRDQRFWPGHAADALGLHQLPTDTLDQRPKGFEALTPLAWCVLWHASWGRGITHLRRLWGGSCSTGWTRRVAIEIATELRRRGIEIPQPWPGTLDWKSKPGKPNLRTLR